MQTFAPDEEKNALKIALQTERDGYQYYTESADKTSNNLLKNTLLSLARDEALHEQYILRYLNTIGSKISDEEKTAIINDESVRQSKVVTIFRKALKQPDKQAALTDTDRGIYEHAIDFEKKGIGFYQNLLNKASDPASKRFYTFLREMEEEHLKVLENSVRYLENPGQYFSEHESWLLEG